MERHSNIIVGDRSALFLYLHSRCDFIASGPDKISPLLSCAQTSVELHAFNFEHPLYGKRPVELLVPYQEARRHSREIDCHCTNHDLPASAFYELRTGLHVASPELSYARMGLFNLSTIRLSQIATDLCARYYITTKGELKERTFYLTNRQRLLEFLEREKGMRGVKKSLDALKYAKDNSASPMETKAMLQFCLPCNRGGFNLPFAHMNFDVKAGKLSNLFMQSEFCLDLVARGCKFGLEYDGKCHDDPSKDKRRLNELKALGWTVFPLDVAILYNPNETIRLAEQIAKAMGVRIRRSASWDEKFCQLRHDLELPC